jgi:hypothetical protein
MCMATCTMAKDLNFLMACATAKSSNLGQTHQEGVRRPLHLYVVLSG